MQQKTSVFETASARPRTLALALALPLALALLAALVAAGCQSNGEQGPPDSGVVPADSAGDSLPATPDGPGAGQDTLPPAPDAAPTSYKVAAVQYASGEHGKVAACASDLCALAELVTEARSLGARLVVTPEYAIDQQVTEPCPKPGDDLLADARWPEGTIIRAMAKVAADQKVTLVFNLWTTEAVSSATNTYNTSIAVDGSGKTIARHHKFQLFSSETKYLTPGESSESSFFSTPAGRAGMLVCADAQCIVTNLTITQDCSAHSVQVLKDYFSAAKRPDIVLFSAYWTVGGATNPWGSLNVQQKIAKDAYAYVIAANTTLGQGRGGGIYKPGGEIIVQDASGTPKVLYAELPLAN